MWCWWLTSIYLPISLRFHYSCHDASTSSSWFSQRPPRLPAFAAESPKKTLRRRTCHQPGREKDVFGKCMFAVFRLFWRVGLNSPLVSPQSFLNWEINFLWYRSVSVEQIYFSAVSLNVEILWMLMLFYYRIYSSRTGSDWTTAIIKVPHQVRSLEDQEHLPSSH